MLGQSQRLSGADQVDILKSMSELAPEEIDHLAKLARITLSPEEKAQFAEQLPEIIGFIDALTTVTKTGSVESAIIPTPQAELRADEVSGERLSIEQLAKLAPAWRDDQVSVPAVFGEVGDA